MIETFFLDLWKRKFFVIYMCVLGVLAALALRGLAAEKKYVFSMNYYVTNSELSKIIVDTSSLDTDSQMTNSCRIILESDLTLETLSDMLIEKYGVDYLKNYFTIGYSGRKPVINEEELSECIDITASDDGTAVLSIDISTDNMYLSQDIGSFLTFLAPNIVYYLVGVDYISPYENARLSIDLGVFQSKKIVACAGAAIGFLLAYLVILFNKTISSHLIVDRNDIVNEMECTLLGQIPYYDIESAVKEYNSATQAKE